MDLWFIPKPGSAIKFFVGNFIGNYIEHFLLEVLMNFIFLPNHTSYLMGIGSLFHRKHHRKIALPGFRRFMLSHRDSHNIF